MRCSDGFRSVVVAICAHIAAGSAALGGELVVDLGKSADVKMVGVLRRWDDEGKPTRPVDPKSKIDEPFVDARGVHEAEGRWVFRNLPAGRYDLVILAGERVRLEGFRYPPVLEFDPFLAADAQPDEEARAFILKHIAGSKHYENKVSPLYLAGDDKQVRILMQLVRDKPTSYDADYGAPAATVRHEIWQYTENHGTWVKEKRTQVLDRVLLKKEELHRWTWVWDPKLGGIEVGDGPASLRYEVPATFDRESARGWFPD